MAEPDYLLTTTDNPFNPWTDFDDWYAEDHRLGHYTCEYLDRVSTNSSSLTDGENAISYIEACQDILRYNPIEPFILIKKDGTTVK